MSNPGAKAPTWIGGFGFNRESALGEIASVDRALDLVWATGDAPTVICSHPGLLNALVERLRWSARVVPVCGLAWVATTPAVASATTGGNR